ncbi:MAG TPA: glycosyltransferase, partial [bacterium]|nr:glycosyltransferase [bacterium]
LAFNAKHLWIPHSIGAMKKENFRGQPPEVTGPLKFAERIAFETEAMKGIDAVISTSGELSKYLRRDYSREPELFLPPCIDTDLIRPLPPGAGCERILDFLSGGDASLRSKLAKSRTVLEVSRTDRTKRKDVVIRAVAKAAKKHPDLMCLLTISPDAKEVYADLCSLMDELGVRDRTVFIGMVPRDIMSELFALSTVYVTPADQETFGMSIQEAAACRRPIISSDRVPFATEYLMKNEREETVETPSGPSKLRWGEGGVVAPSGDHEAFGYALERILSDKSLQESLADGAYRATIPYFTWPNLTRELLRKAEVKIPADA